MDIRIHVAMERALFGSILRTGMRRHFRRLWSFGAVGCAIGLLLLSFKSDGASISLTAAAAVMCALPSLVMVLSYRRLARLPQVPWSYRITAEWLAESTPMYSSSRPWTAVRAVACQSALSLPSRRPSWMPCCAPGDSCPHNYRILKLLLDLCATGVAAHSHGRRADGRLRSRYCESGGLLRATSLRRSSGSYELPASTGR
jgi:hypothetical protein